VMFGGNQDGLHAQRPTRPRRHRATTVGRTSSGPGPFRGSHVGNTAPPSDSGQALV